MLFVAAALLASFAQAESFVWRVDASQTDAMSKTAEVLQARFKELKPGFFDSASVKVTGNLLTASFSGWTPTRKQADFLAQSRGQFRVTLDSDNEVLASERDIVEARPWSKTTSEIAIRFNDSTAKRLSERTPASIGKYVTVAFDGRVISHPRLSEPLGRDIAISVPSAEAANLMSIVLRSGSYPPGVVLTSVGQ
jgi:preprotein translocase subunit SecD